MAAARKSKPRARARNRRSRAHLPGLEQRHLDLLGLALVALSAFLGFVLYGGWQAGQAGEGLIQGGRGLGGGGRFPGPIRFPPAGAIPAPPPRVAAGPPLSPAGARPLRAPGASAC